MGLDIHSMPLQIIRENVIHMKTDAIGNTTNTSLQVGGGVCGSIFVNVNEKVNQALMKK